MVSEALEEPGLPQAERARTAMAPAAAALRMVDRIMLDSFRMERMGMKTGG
jgi:hypothetical protein